LEEVKIPYTLFQTGAGPKLASVMHRSDLISQMGKRLSGEQEMPQLVGLANKTALDSLRMPSRISRRTSLNLNQFGLKATVIVTHSQLIK